MKKIICYVFGYFVLMIVAVFLGNVLGAHWDKKEVTSILDQGVQSFKSDDNGEIIKPGHPRFQELWNIHYETPE